LLVANGSRVDDDPEAIRLFIAALAKGTRDAASDPEAATRAVLAEGRGLDPRLTGAEVEATLPLLQPQRGRPFGYMETREWEAFAGWMADNELISEVPEMDEVLTNDLLPR
jgi:ABC-type nitrate/sulfonate/bicarbonate transport system substrate-binding protein